MEISSVCPLSERVIVPIAKNVPENIVTEEHGMLLLLYFFILHEVKQKY